MLSLRVGTQIGPVPFNDAGASKKYWGQSDEWGNI